MNTLGIFVKQPVPGQVKTRLAQELGAETAAKLYAAFTADLLKRFRDVADQRIVCYAPAITEAGDYFCRLAGDDYRLWLQPAGPLGQRMARFFSEYLSADHDRVVLIGSDSPTLPKEIVSQAFDLLTQRDCVLGPATDGGYYLIGQRSTPRPLFDDICWSSPKVLEQTVDRVAKCSATLALLPPWYDVDTLDDLQVLRGHIRAHQLAGPPTFPQQTELLLRENLEMVAGDMPQT